MIAAFIYRSGIFHVWARYSRCTAILLFHRVSGGYDPLFMNVSQDTFDSMMRFIRKHFVNIPLRQVVDSPRPADRRVQVAVTFDDGYRDNFENAYPILRSRNIRATIFLATSGIGRETPLWYDEVAFRLWNTKCSSMDLHPFGLETFDLSSGEKKTEAIRSVVRALKGSPPSGIDALLCHFRALPMRSTEDSTYLTGWEMLSVQEIREMAKDGLVEFGPHTVNHVILSSVDADRCREEILGSRKALEELLGKPPDMFSYPNGSRDDFNDEAIGILKGSGFRMAVTTIPGTYRDGGDPYRIPRISLHDNVCRTPFTGSFSPALFAFSIFRSAMDNA
jgi:peptidoglycan/xylan/chitin deacetylase (PgdA/CDA1 family)